MTKNQLKEALLPPERVRELFDYNAEDGVLYWRPRPGENHFNAVFAGKPAGARSGKYLVVTFSQTGHRVLVHLLVWAWVTGVWPRNVIDHRDRDKLNNRFGNLRECDSSQNASNKDSVLGAVRFKGVTFDTKTGRYRARITVGSRRKSLGLFDTALSAAEAYDRAVDQQKGFGVTNASLGLLGGAV